MDSVSIKQCLSVPSCKGKLRGIADVNKWRVPKGNSNGDCYVFNTDSGGGEHWLCVLYSRQIWYLFDCSLMTPESVHEKILKQLNGSGWQVSMQIDQLQGLESMTCGEHCICFLYNVALSLANCSAAAAAHSSAPAAAVVDLHYNRVLRKVCRESSPLPPLSCDQFVTNFVYTSGLFSVAKPPLRSVSKWLRKGGL